MLYFTSKMLFILHKLSVMSDNIIIDGCNVLTGKSSEGDLWDSLILNGEHLTSPPFPNDPCWLIQGINYYTTFQTAQRQCCIEQQYMHVPLVIFYEHVHSDFHDVLGARLLLFSFGLFKLHVLHLLFFWKTIGYVPNLNVGGRRLCRINALEK